jgi:hypothetical protein
MKFLKNHIILHEIGILELIEIEFNPKKARIHILELIKYLEKSDPSEALKNSIIT